MDLPWKIYEKQKNWVPPLKIAVKEILNQKKNPFYKNAEMELFLAKYNGEIVGRIAAIANHSYNNFHNDMTGFYGFFESINDQSVADELFKAAENWLSEKGFDKMQGPVNPSTNHECGLLIRGQSQHPTIQTTYNPKYYQTLHEAHGLEKAKDLVAYWLPTEKIAILPDKITKVAERCRKNHNLTFRDIDLKNFDHDIKICFDIYNSAWEKNWGFFPMTEEEFIHAAQDMKMIMDPHFAFIAEKEGNPAGFMFAIPDVNHIFKKIRSGKLFPTGIFKLLFGRRLLKTVRVVALGVKPEFRNTGIFGLFNHEAFIRAKKYGLIGGEASWILEDNLAMNKPWTDIGAPLYRRWRIYEKPLPRNAKWGQAQLIN